MFSKKTGFDISCKLSPVETICTKCQILFSRENKKNPLSSAELAQRVVKVNSETKRVANGKKDYATYENIE